MEIKALATSSQAAMRLANRLSQSKRRIIQLPIKAASRLAAQQTKKLAPRAFVLVVQLHRLPTGDEKRSGIEG
jgi:hypothetical protein